MKGKAKETAHFVGCNKKHTEVWVICNHETRTYRFYRRRPIRSYMPAGKINDENNFVESTGYMYFTTEFKFHWQPEYEDAYEVGLIKEALARMSAAVQSGAKARS